MPETLVIGLGGVGAQVGRRFYERLAPLLAFPSADGQERSQPELLLLDTDRAAGQAMPERSLVLTTTAAVVDAAYRSPERFRAEWVQRDVLRGQGFMGQGTRGNRMLGRFLLLLPENLAALRQRLKQWLSSPAAAPATAPHLPFGQGTGARHRRVYVIAGAAGGTGGGQVVDMGYLLQEEAALAEVQLDLRAILLVPPPSEPRLALNAFATLTELHYFSDPWTRYRAHLGEGEAPFETRRGPYHRVSLLTSLTPEGEVIPLAELQERASVYLLTACFGDDGHWETERAQREAQVGLRDPDGNPQVFTTFGAEWVEYPEERLAGAVYRNLVRRSLYPWLQGDQPAPANELPTAVPLRDSEALAAMLAGVDPGEDNADSLLRPLRSRLSWIHKAPSSQWTVMDQELEAAVAEAKGTAPGPGRPAKGPMADRFRALRERALADFRQQSAVWLKRENLNLERVARVLNEAATELRTTSDPAGAWEEAREAALRGKGRILWAGTAIRQDPFLLFWRRLALRHLASEYERIAAVYVRNSLRAHSLLFLRELRLQILEPIRAWAGRMGEIGALFGKLSRSMADYESSLLERLRKDEEEHRLVLGLLRLPGAETPYVAHSGWNLPYCRPEDEASAIRDLRQGWIQRLVERDDGLLADPGRSILDGPADSLREERLPWLMPTSFTPALEGTSERMRQAVTHIDRELRAALEDRLRTWLSATAFQRLAEQYRNPVELEYQLRRLVTGAADLPALDPPHARPAGFPREYELVFFGEAKAGELPPVLKMVVDAAGQERPVGAVPSRSPHYLTAIAEHPGFALSRCPTYHHLEEAFQEWSRAAGARGTLPFSRADIPWRSATLVTLPRLRNASDLLYLALALGLLRANPRGEIPFPGSLLPADGGEQRFPLPGEFDLAVRQLAGDVGALEAVSQAVDRTVQSKGVEWCCLQLERAVLGENPLQIRFPGAEPKQQARAARLAALRAACRYEDLLQEYGRTVTFRDTEWMRAGSTYFCPACGHHLGTEAEAVPGACPACRQPLLPHKIRGLGAADGFRRIPNPYVVGTPLETRSSVFVGREDIIQQVRDRLIRPAQRTILILIGERRCGKTSALRQLQYRLEADLTPLFIDMQGLTASDLPGFLWWLAWRMKEALEDRGIRVDLPTYEVFTSGPPDYQFETIILPEIRRKLSGGRVLLMLDEFEVLAQRVMNGTFDSRAFDYIRHLMQHGEGIEFLFAGTHVLRQFAANYVTFLFNIGVFLNVDFLTREDALRLIQEPLAAAGVTYSPEALASLLELAGAHAYFTQMFCFHLVERLNRLRKRNVTREDVEAESGPVIAAAGAHLDHVWGQLGNAERLLVAFFVDFCLRGRRCPEEEVLAAAIRDDASLRPFIFRSAVEKLMAVGLLRGAMETTVEGRQTRVLSLTAEVYRQWLLTAHPYSRQREEGTAWE